MRKSPSERNVGDGLLLVRPEQIAMGSGHPKVMQVRHRGRIPELPETLLQSPNADLGCHRDIVERNRLGDVFLHEVDGPFHMAWGRCRSRERKLVRITMGAGL